VEPVGDLGPLTLTSHPGRRRPAACYRPARRKSTLAKLPTARPGLLSGSDPHSRGFRRIVTLLVVLVTVPTFLLLAVGILMLVFWRGSIDVVLGILVVAIVVCLITGTVLAMVWLRREARVSRLQADFVSKVSHELRTPLTSIRLFVESLQMKKVPEQEMEACFDVLADETARLSGRIERLLDWGRMQAGKRVYELTEDDVPSIVRDAIEAFHTANVGREVAVDVRVADGLPSVMADRGAVVDALVNLLSNAVKYGGEDDWIGLVADFGDRCVRLSVSDHGIGIPRSEQRRIFQKFYRVDERLSRSAEGTGLGLAIVSHVVRAHGGRVRVESTPGKGSTFTLSLPPHRAADELTTERAETD
jgi:two-component system, OmpR family, phosphate regulon sensor histidine kinase PhoR